MEAAGRVARRVGKRCLLALAGTSGSLRRSTYGITPAIGLHARPRAAALPAAIPTRCLVVQSMDCIAAQTLALARVIAAVEALGKTITVGQTVRRCVVCGRPRWVLLLGSTA